MSYETYPLPGNASDSAKIDTLLSAQANALNMLVNDLQGSTDQRILAQQQGINPVISRLSRSIGSTVNRNNRLLAPIIHTLDNAVTSATTENQVAINLLPAHVSTAVTAASNPIVTTHPPIPSVQPTLSPKPVQPTGNWYVLSRCKQDGSAIEYMAFPMAEYSPVNPPRGSGFNWTPFQGFLTQVQAEEDSSKLNAENNPCGTGITQPQPTPVVTPPTPTTPPVPVTTPPPPPPGPTSQPPTPEKMVACPDTPFGYPTGKWCEDFIALRTYLISVGTVIMESGANPDRIPNIPIDWYDRLFTGSEAWIDFGNQVRPALENILSSPNQSHLIMCWVNGLKNILGIVVYDVLPLYAVRRALVLVDSYIINDGATQDRTSGMSSGIGLGALGTEVGSHNDRSEHASFGFAGSVHPCLVPAIELVDRMIESLIASELPSISDAIESYLKGTIEKSHFQCLVEINGGNINEWLPVLDSRRERLDTRELIEFARRNNIDNDTQLQWLRAIGWLRTDEAQARIALYDELPSIAEHLHWLQRNVFDDTYVQDFDLLNGFEERFWAKFGQQLYAQGFTKDRASLHYAAHWINPAPGQLAEMMQRLRPGRVPDNLVFDSDSYQRVLAEQDVAPYFREKFLATSYERQPRSYVQQLFFDNVIDSQEVIDRYRDLGYTIEDSNLMQQEDILLKARTRSRTAVGYSPQAISDLYLVGILSMDDVAKRMATLGYTTDEATSLMEVTDGRFQSRSIRFAMRRVYTLSAQSAISAYGQGTVDYETAKKTLTSTGWPDGAADTALQAEDIKVRNDSVKQVANKVKKSYLDGAISLLEATNILAQMGVANARIADWANTWSLLLDANVKVASTAKTLDWLQRGLIDVISARNRLINLGWRDPDLALHLAETGQKIAEREGKMLQAEQSNERRAANEIAKLAKQSQQQTDRLQASLRRRRPVSRLMKWLQKQYINQDFFNSTMQAEGYSPEEIRLYFEQAMSNGTSKKA